MPRFAPYGFVRGQLNIYVPFPTGGTSAVEIVTDYVAGFTYTIESVKAYVAVVGTGSSPTRTLRVIKGASTVTATGTLDGTATGTLGKETALTLSTTATELDFADADTLTVDFASGGTTFTAGSVNLVITYRAQPQRKA